MSIQRMEGENDVVRRTRRDRSGGRPYHDSGFALGAEGEGLFRLPFRQRQSRDFFGGGSDHGKSGGKPGNHGDSTVVLSIRFFRLVVHVRLLFRLPGAGPII